MSSRVTKYFAPSIRKICKCSRPRLVVLSADKTSLRLGPLKNPPQGGFFLTWSPEQEIIINILSDQSYMKGLYNQLMFIKALQTNKSWQKIKYRYKNVYTTKLNPTIFVWWIRCGYSVKMLLKRSRGGSKIVSKLCKNC